MGTAGMNLTQLHELAMMFVLGGFAGYWIGYFIGCREVRGYEEAGKGNAEPEEKIGDLHDGP
jgi:hypothetical protein